MFCDLRFSEIFSLQQYVDNVFCLLVNSGIAFNFALFTQEYVHTFSLVCWYVW